MAESTDKKWQTPLALALNNAINDAIDKGIDESRAFAAHVTTFPEVVEQYEKMRSVLDASRHSLLLCGFVGPGKHGSGDPEIARIDEVLSH